MPYPTIKLRIQKYDWTVELYEMTENESEHIQSAVKDDDNEALLDIVSGLIKNWNCTDRVGNKLEVNSEGLRELPSHVIQQIMLASKTGKGSTFDDPKTLSSSLQHTQEEAVASNESKTLV